MVPLGLFPAVCVTPFIRLPPTVNQASEWIIVESIGHCLAACPGRGDGGESLSQKGTVRGVGHSMVMRVRWLPRKQVEDIPDLAR